MGRNSAGVAGGMAVVDDPARQLTDRNLIGRGAIMDEREGQCRKCLSFGYCYFPDNCGRDQSVEEQTMADLVTIHFPEVEQKRYCATCHAPTGVHVYPAITVEVPPEAGASQPSTVAFCHYARCPEHT